MISEPRTVIARPGSRNRWLGLWTSRKRRWRQPSRRLDSFDSPPRGRYSIGNSAIFRFSLAARMTISDANSMPVVRRSRRGSTSRRRARIPQWASLTPVWKNVLRIPVRHRVADVAVMPRHRPGLDVLHPVAHHELGAVLELRDEPRDLGEVVRLVGVTHDDVGAARGREPGQVGAAVAAPALGDDARAGLGRQLGRAVLGRVVDDDHLAADAGLRHRLARAGDARLDVDLLVEARDHHRDERLGRDAAGVVQRGGEVLGGAHRRAVIGAAWLSVPDVCDASRPQMRVCVVYDCLFPYTVGGAERWYRNLALRLRDDGHEVTFVTLRQWDRGTFDDLPGIEVVTAGPRMGLYTGDRRRILPPLVFGAGVLWHLAAPRSTLRRCSHCLVSVLLAAGRGARFVLSMRYRLTVDWHEVWSRRLLARLPRPRRRRDRLRRPGPVRADPAARLRVLAPARRAAARGGAARRGDGARGRVRPRPCGAGGRRAVAGRRRRRIRRAPHPREARAGRRRRGRRGGERRCRDCAGSCSATGWSAARAGRGDRAAATRRRSCEAPGFVDASVVDDALRRALCMLLPSSREGYGLIVVESAAVGTPSVVVRDADNAAVELIEDGVNGVDRGQRVAGRPGGRDRPRRTRAATRCGARPPTGTRPTRSGCRWRRRCRRCWPAMTRRRAR